MVRQLIDDVDLLLKVHDITTYHTLAHNTQINETSIWTTLVDLFSVFV